MIRPRLVISGALTLALTLLAPHTAIAHPAQILSSGSTPAADGVAAGARNLIVEDAPAFWLDIGAHLDPPKPGFSEGSGVIDVNETGGALVETAMGTYHYDTVNDRAIYYGPFDELRGYAIDDEARIVGNLKVGPGVRHAMTIHPESGEVTDIGALPGDTFARAEAINDEGTIVGVSRGVHDSVFAYDLLTSTMTDLGSMGGTSPRPLALSDDGVVVGTVRIGELSKAFAYDLAAGAPIVLDDPPGATHTNPAGVGGGFIAGGAEIDGSSKPVVWDVATGAVTLIDAPDCYFSDVNDAGVAVGNCWNESVAIGSYVATLDLTEPTSELEMISPPPVAGPRSNRVAQANSITDNGLIGGSAKFDAGHHATLYGPFTFNDVPPTHPFFADIGWLAHENITGGLPDGTFGAAKPITRQSMAAFLYRMAGSPWLTIGTFPFEDCDGIRFRLEVYWLEQQGIATGFPDGGFHPSDSVTRQSMAAFLYRFAGSPAFTPPTAASFTDVPADHPFFTEIEWLAGEGVTTGYPDGTFRPGSIVTRQSMAAFLHRFADGPGAP